MARTPRHRHNMVETGREVTRPDRKQRVTVVVTLQCDFAGPPRCTRTRRKKRRMTYWTRTDL